ncbi:MAG: hypothetical protein IKP36_02360 [Bacteroidaceae bacterium]|nr:hypothetical protein [Bacteroidaceae bacterium]
MKIYYQALKIYFQALKIIMCRAAWTFIAGHKNFAGVLSWLSSLPENPQNQARMTKKRRIANNFSLFPFPFSLFVVPLQPQMEKVCI